MATKSTKVVVVETTAHLSSCLEELRYLNELSTNRPLIPTNAPVLYLALEGVNLGQDGKISILQLYDPTKHTIYLIDVNNLQKTAFTTVNSIGQSLKIILETESIQKRIFDLRNDSAALFAHYGIRLDAIVDIQLLELASRNNSRILVAGLSKCVESDSLIPPSHEESMDAH